MGAVALLVRAGFAILFAQNPLGRYLYLDSRLYDQIALAIGAGTPHTGAFFVEPLYAYLLAATYWMAGHQLWLVRGLQALGGAATAVLAAALGERICNRRGAWICGLATALYGPLVFYDAMVLKTSFEILLLTTIGWLLLAAWRSPSVAKFAGVGALLGIAVLLRGNFLVLAPLVIAAAWWATPRGKALRAGGFAAALLVAIVPLLAFNHARSGAWLLTTGAGMNFYQGNNAEATGGLEIPTYIQTDPEHEEADSIAEASRRAGRALSAVESSSFWFQESTQYIRASPVAWLRLMGSKLVLFWNHFEAADDLSLPYTRRVIPFLWIPCLGFWLIGPLGLAGAMAGLRNGAERRILAGVVLLWMLSVVLFHVADRYRLAIVPLLIVLGCRFVHDLTAAWRSEPGTVQRRSLLVALTVLALTTALVSVPNPYAGGQDEAPFDRILAFGYAEDGRQDLAAIYNQRAAQAFSRHAHDALAQGEIPRAEISLRALLESAPEFPGARFQHGLTLERLGRTQDAVEELERVVAGGSNVAEALTHLGRLHLDRGELEASEKALVDALQREPTRVLALVTLGDLRSRQQRPDEARVLYERALAQQPAAKWVQDRIAALPH